MTVAEMEQFISQFLGIPYRPVTIDEIFAASAKRRHDTKGPIRYTTGEFDCSNIPLFGKFFDTAIITIDQWFGAPDAMRLHIDYTIRGGGHNGNSLDLFRHSNGEWTTQRPYGVGTTSMDTAK